MPLKSSIIGLIVFLVVCFAAAGIGKAVTRPKIATWYAALTAGYRLLTPTPYRLIKCG
jgi:hypothetical protein